MKTLSTLLLLVAMAAAAADPPAKPAQPATPAPASDASAEDALRAALEKAYAAEAPTNVAPRTTNATTTPAKATAPAAPVTPPATTPAQPPSVTAVPATMPVAAATPTTAPATSAVPGGWTIRPATNTPNYRPVTNVLAALTNLSGVNTNLAAALTNIIATATNLAGAPTNRPPRTLQGPPGFPQPANPAAPTRIPGGVATAGGPTNALGLAPAGVSDPNQEILPAGLLKFNEADLSQVLEIYQDLTGRTVLKPNSLAATKISIRTQTPLTRTEAVQALDSILSMNGITMVPQGEKFVKALQEAQAGQAGQRFNTNDVTGLPEAGVLVTQVIQLTNAAPNDLVPVLQPFAKLPQSILTIPSVNMLVLRDYAENIKRMVEMIKKVDVIPQQEFVDVVIPIKYALAGDIATVLGNLTAGGGSTTTVGGGGTSRGGLSGGVGGGFGSRGGVGGVGGGVGGFGGQGAYGQNQGFGQQQAGLAGAGGVGGAAGGQRSSFQQRLQNIVNRASGASGDFFVLGSTKIIADERTNSLLIFASKPDLVTISNIIGKLDVVLAQVLIETIILEVTIGDSLDYGFSYVQRKPSTIGNFMGAGLINNVPFLNNSDFVNTNSGALPGGFTYVASFMGFDAVLRAIAGDNRARILQRPRIQTSHAEEANLFVGETRPYPTTSYYGGGAFGGYSSIQQLQIGVTLSVLPLVNADGLVVMDIRQRIQAAAGTVRIDNVGDVPVTTEKEANAKVAVRDGEVIMLGGFISTSKDKSASGVPILKDIPLIGPLFRSTKTGDSRSELVVLIRPTVLPTPLDAARFASDERSRLPATREFENEVKEAEQKELQNSNKESKSYKRVFE